MQAPDLEDVKDSVRQGVSKVAGRLSNVASGVMTQLQVRIRSCSTADMLSVVSFLVVQMP